MAAQWLLWDSATKSQETPKPALPVRRYHHPRCRSRTQRHSRSPIESLSAARLQHSTQRTAPLSCLALHRPRGAAEHLRGLVHAEIAVEPQHKRGPLPRRQQNNGPAKVEGHIVVMDWPKPIRNRARQNHPARPPLTPNLQEFADQDPADIPIYLVRRLRLAPVHVQPRSRRLHQIISTIPVLAQQVGEPPQPRQPSLHILGELYVAARAQARPSSFVGGSTTNRCAWRPVRLSRTVKSLP